MIVILSLNTICNILQFFPQIRLLSFLFSNGKSLRLTVVSTRSSYGLDEIVLEDGSLVERGSWLAELPFEEKLDLIHRAAEPSSNLCKVSSWLSSLGLLETAYTQVTACLHTSHIPVDNLQSDQVQVSIDNLTLKEDQASSCTLTSRKSSETIDYSSVFTVSLYDSVLPPQQEDGIFRIRSIFARKNAPPAAISPRTRGSGYLGAVARSARKTATPMRLA